MVRSVCAQLYEGLHPYPLLCSCRPWNPSKDTPSKIRVSISTYIEVCVWGGVCINL